MHIKIDDIIGLTDEEKIQVRQLNLSPKIFITKDQPIFEDEHKIAQINRDILYLYSEEVKRKVV